MFYYRLITRHRLEMSHLHEWKYKHDLVVNLDIELTTFLLHYPKFNNITHTLLNTLNNIDRKILESTNSFLTQTSLLGSTLFVTETYFFLTQPSTTLYSLKDSKNFRVQSFNPFRISVVLLYLSLEFIFAHYSQFIFLQEKFSEPCQTSKMEQFAKSRNLFS